VSVVVVVVVVVVAVSFDVVSATAGANNPSVRMLPTDNARAVFLLVIHSLLGERVAPTTSIVDRIPERRCPGLLGETVNGHGPELS
jgi:hypothetical protein